VADLGAASLLQVLEAGPAPEELASARRAELPSPFQGLGERLLQQAGEAVGKAGAILHQGAPVLAQHLDLPGRGIVRLPDAQTVGVATHQFQEQIGVLRIALRSAAKEGLA